jgi:hypothetical protein
MKKLLIALILGLVFTLAATGFTSAQEMSITVSLSIPSVPGLNAPASEKQTEQQTDQNEQTFLASSAGSKKPIGNSQQTENLILAQATNSERTIQTVYSR